MKTWPSEETLKLLPLFNKVDPKIYFTIPPQLKKTFTPEYDESLRFAQRVIHGMGRGYRPEEIISVPVLSSV